MRAGTFQQKSTFSVKPQTEHVSDGDLGGRDEKLYETLGVPPTSPWSRNVSEETNFT